MSDDALSLFPSDPAAAAAPTVLARKYRPRRFAEVIGQDLVVSAMQHGLRQGRLHHAYLLTGSRGIGKTTLARILAKALNCESGPAEEPCGACSSCVGIDRGRFVDYLELDAASNRGVLEVQQLLEQSRFAPTEGRYKVFVVDEVHMLSGHAFNAMLKTLEEPPPRVIFVLATTDPQKIPVTVLSRCLQFSLRNLLPEPLAAHLERVLAAEAIPAEPEAVTLLAHAGRGSVRDALSLCDQAIATGGGTVTTSVVQTMLGLVGQEQLVGLLETIAAGDAQGALAQAESLLLAGALTESIFDELARLSHQLAVAQVLGTEALDGESSSGGAERLAQLSAAFTPEGIQLVYQILTLARRDLSLAPDDATALRMAVLRLLAFRLDAVALGPSHHAADHKPTQLASARAAAADQQSALPLLAAAAPKSSAGAAMQVAAVPPAGPLTVPPLPKGGWPALVSQLTVFGLTRQVALHSICLSWPLTNDQPILLAVAVASLADPDVAARLQDAVSARLEMPVILRLQGGGDAQATPAGLEEARAEARQAAAEATFKRSPLVKELMDAYGASIVPGSIRPAKCNDSPAEQSPSDPSPSP